MPLAVLAAFVFILRELFFFHALIPLACGGLAALAASFYCDFMKDDKSSRFAANLRGGIAVLLAAYLVSSLLTRGAGAWYERFLPGLNSIAASSGALYVWTQVCSLKQLFTCRKQFDEYAQTFRGSRLQEALSDNPALLSYTNEKIIQTRKSYFAQLAIAALLLITTAFIKTRFPAPLYFFLILLLLGAACLFGFLVIFSREQYFAGEGITLPPFDRVKRMISIGILCGLCAVIASLFSFNKNILSVSPIIAFLKRLLLFLQRFIKPRAGAALPELDFPLMNMDLNSAFPDLGELKEPWKIWTWLKYGLIAFLAGAFAWFMVSPLFNKGGKAGKLTFLQRLRLIIKEWAKGLLDAFILFLVLIKNSGGALKLRKPNSDEIRKMAETVLGAYTAAKKRDIKRSVTLFARLIIWGGEVLHVTWKPSFAPGEYCGILASNLVTNALTPPVIPAESAPAETGTAADRAEWIIRSGELFEKALYSAEALSDAEQKEFKDLIEAVTNSETGQETVTSI
jgi:hypothetical protein